ncbi:hypothetical protein GPECTOR_33g676 [Gonium pectorale]|uniref:CSC1/OSCA1-like 7TM region domain-containing protein n=1 Tax=Gonium pectorale TaxID=33097 RepID=A0A150GD81_GONPE|nr:hypothetical protein GPECTOR_33g676 [Gonium pectorale]|eukprot:KXZ47794.1 hypothetical protein GPECTOR_33g676 [Gonium pectorale]
MSAEEMLRQLEELQAGEEQLHMKPEWSVDTSPPPPSRRTDKRFNYDLHDCSLESAFQAKQQLESGLTPVEMVEREFAMVYSSSAIAAVNIVHDTGRLEPLADEYTQLSEALEDYLDMLQLRLRLRKGMPHKKVDAVDFWIKRLKYLRERILVEQQAAARRVTPSAFVTFNTRMAQAVGANSLHSHDINTWRVQNAPAPFEVVWKNLGMTTPMKAGRLYILWAAFWAMTLFFMVPVTAIQALIEVPKLAKIPVLGDIVTAPGVRQILEAIIPGLALKVFLAIVPIILRHMAILSGTMSISEIDFGVVSRYFLFQVIVVFFGNIIAGSFFNQLTQWIKSPTGVIPTLGKSIPMTSTFFITYLLTNTFSCINPIVCPAALAYFLVTFLGEAYNNIYVFRRRYESAGKLWKTVYNQVMVGLYIMQLTMLGLLGIKSFPYTVLGFPLLIFSAICHIGTLNLYRRPWLVTALHDAAELDMWEANRIRMSLFEAAKRERKQSLRQLAQGAGSGTNVAPGAAEVRLRAVLKDDRAALALTPEEQAEVSRVYRDPAFKVPLNDLEALEALANDLLPRLDVLNEWTAGLKKSGKKPAPAGAPTKRDVESAPNIRTDAGSQGVETPPVEVTKYDNKPLLDADDDEAEH